MLRRAWELRDGLRLAVASSDGTTDIKVVMQSLADSLCQSDAGNKVPPSMGVTLHDNARSVGFC